MIAARTELTQSYITYEITDILNITRNLWEMKQESNFYLTVGFLSEHCQFQEQIFELNFVGI